MARLLVPVPVAVPDLGYFNRAVPGTRVFCRGSTELTKVLGTDNTRGMYPLYTLVRTLSNTNLHVSVPGTTNGSNTFRIMLHVI